MLQALGFDILDQDGKQVALGAQGLKDIKTISDKNAIPELKECSFSVLCDVKNPLCGENGCSRVFAPQKGATEHMIEDMDGWLNSFADIAKQNFENADKNAEGAGAAGGMGFALMTFMGAKLYRGIDLVLKIIELEKHIKNADIVVTGEGKLDLQTAMGKVPVGVARLAKKYNRPVIAFAGGIGEGAEALNQSGIDAFFPAVRGVCTLKEAMDRETAHKNLAASCEQAFRLIKIAK
jgi:glycerate kinase